MVIREEKRVSVHLKDLTANDVKKILLFDVPLRNKALLVFCFYAEMCVSDIEKMKISDVFNGRVVYSQINIEIAWGKQQTVIFNKDVLTILALYCEQLIKAGYSLNDPLFISRETVKKENGSGKIAKFAKPLGRFQINNILKSLIGMLPKQFAVLKNEKMDGKKSYVTKKHIRKAIPNILRFGVFKRDGFKCLCCGRGAVDGVKLHVDHILPVAKGGTNDLNNLQTLCGDCNLGKRATEINLLEREKIGQQPMQLFGNS